MEDECRVNDLTQYTGWILVPSDSSYFFESLHSLVVVGMVP